MASRETTEPVSQGDLTPLFIWIGTIAKVLVQSGLLNRDLLIKEFQTIKSAGSTMDLELTLDGMMNRVRSW